jgi:quercetin dioxygenase-like cupin family protein
LSPINLEEIVMGRSQSQALLSCAAVAAFLFATPAWAVHGGEGMHEVTQWGDAPPTLPKGAKLAVLLGDPAKPGPFVMRMRAPAGYRVAPHWHSQAENVTVISGTFMVGMGEKFDPKVMKTMKAGSFGSIEPKQPHYAMAKTPTEIQIHGEGPFDITYVNDKDDPSKAK